MSTFRLPGIQISPFYEHDRRQLELAAADDHHTAVAPSHVVRKDQQIVGHLAINTIPAVSLWLHSQKVRAREAYQVGQFVENFLAGCGARAFMIPCPLNSPLRKYMQEVGYVSAGEHELFLKNL